MAHRLFLLAAHLGEGPVMPFGLEDRVITETGIATRRPDNLADHLAAIMREPAIGMSDSDDAHEAGRPVCTTTAFKGVVNPPHRETEVSGLARPSRRVDTGITAERVNGKTGIIGDTDPSGGLAGRPGLQRSITFECAFRFFGFIQRAICSAQQIHADGLEFLT